MHKLFLLIALLAASTLSAQTVQVPYSGQAPYNGSMSVQVQVTGLPSGCSIGTPTYANGTIAVPVNCGVVPPPVGTNCASSTTPLTGCTIGSTVAVVSTPGTVRNPPQAGGAPTNPALGTVPGGTKGIIMSNPVPQSTAGKGWQVVNFGGTCNAAGPYSATCGYVGNDNLAPSGVTPLPVTTCTTTLAPSGGQDNAGLLAAISKAGSGCVELLKGTFSLSAMTPPSAKLVLDDGVVIQDFGIFGRTTPFFTVQNPLSIVGAGPLFSAVVTMPTNYANAKVQVGKGQDYEYQHCFALTNSVSGVVLSNLSLLNCAGDGVTFVNTSGATLTNINSATNIRQGMAVTGPATNVTITGGNLHDGPLSGLDVEPDSGISGNIQMAITGLHTTNNAGGGTSFGLMNLTSASSVNITDTNPVSTNDGGTAYAFWNGSNNVAPTGTITVTNAVSTGSGANCSYGQRSSIGYQIVFNGLTCTNSNSKTTTGPNQTNTALGLQCNSCSSGSVPGGVQWLNVTLSGGNGSFSVPSNSAAVKISGTYNGKAISYP